MELTITIKDAEVQAALQKLAASVQNMKPVLTRIGLYYEKSVRQNFDNQSDPEGKPWQKLSNATLHLGIFGANGFKKGKKTKGYLNTKGRSFLQGKRILIEKGDLVTSIHSQADTSSVTIGTGGHIKYAAIHQFGGPAGRKSKRVQIPARPYLAVNVGSNGMELAEKDRLMILKLIEEYMKEQQQPL